MQPNHLEQFVESHQYAVETFIISCERFYLTKCYTTHQWVVGAFIDSSSSCIDDPNEPITSYATIIEAIHDFLNRCREE